MIKMMKVELQPRRMQTLVLCLGLGFASALSMTATAAFAQRLPGTENGEWRYLGGDAGHTRSAPMLDQINATNFANLEVDWIWRSDNFGPNVYAQTTSYARLTGEDIPQGSGVIWVFALP